VRNATQKGDGRPNPTQGDERDQSLLSFVLGLQIGKNRGEEEMQERRMMFEVVTVRELSIRDEKGAMSVLKLVGIESSTLDEVRLKCEKGQHERQETGHGKHADKSVNPLGAATWIGGRQSAALPQ
jgi:hypothetical protein